MSQMQIYMALTKVDAERREVHGRAAQEVLDKSGEVMDYASSKPLFEAWSQGIADATNGKSFGNVRAMHGNVAAGKLIDIHFDDEAKAIDVVAKVIDDDEWQKVQESVYTGFSIGGKYAKRWAIDGVTHYTADPVEVSLVDNPAIPTATFSLIKMDGAAVAKGETMSKKDDDEKGDYGTHAEAGYADPGYQEDEKPRYPLKEDGKLSPERIRAAWSYIHKEKDDDKYTAKEIERIKARIVSAWKKAIDPEGPPEADEDDDARKARRGREDEHKKSMRAEADKEAEPDDAEKARRVKMDKTDEDRRKKEDDDAEKARKSKKAADGDLAKGMNSVSALAQILSGIAALQNTAEWESEQEGDHSQIPEQLRSAITNLGDILKDMVTEEVAELAANPSTPNPYPSLYLAAEALLQKRGARHSAADMERVQKIHDLALELGAKGDPAQKSANADELVKAEVGVRADGDLRKANEAIGSLTTELQKALTRIEQLELQPAAAKGVLKSIGKSEDNPAASPEQPPVVYTPSGQKSEVASLIKGLHLSGGRPLVGG